MVDQALGKDVSDSGSGDGRIASLPIELEQHWLEATGNELGSQLMDGRQPDPIGVDHKLTQGNIELSEGQGWEHVALHLCLELLQGVAKASGGVLGIGNLGSVENWHCRHTSGSPAGPECVGTKEALVSAG
jgi:hypothetical protein